MFVRDSFGFPAFSSSSLHYILGHFFLASTFWISAITPFLPSRTFLFLLPASDLRITLS